MLSKSRTPQPTLQELMAKYKGPGEIWFGENHDAALQWPNPWESKLGYSMEVR